MRPLVSILIPAFKAQEWIGDTLRSAIAQTWPNKEIIVVDDGSPDGTAEAARRFSSQGVQVFTQQNQGAAAARNMAFSLSHGDYIQWLDADDLLSPKKISSQMDVLGENPDKRTLVSSGWGQFMYRYHHAKFIPTDLWRDLTAVEWMQIAMEQNLHMQTATWLVSRELTEAAGPWNTKLLGDDDGEYFGRIMMQSSRIRFAPEAKVFYRASGASSLSYIGRSNKKMEAQFLSMKLHVDALLSLENSARSRAACVTYLQTWLHNFYPERPDLVEQFLQMAAQLGGQLEIPRLSWKYSWMEALFGWGLAKQAQVFLRRVRWSCVRGWDKMLFRIEGRKAVGYLAS